MLVIFCLKLVNIRVRLSGGSCMRTNNFWKEIFVVIEVVFRYLVILFLNQTTFFVFETFIIKLAWNVIMHCVGISSMRYT